MATCATVLGMTGGFGNAVATALIGRGWKVRALSRDLAQAARRFPTSAAIEWIEGDALDKGAVATATAGSSVIVHAVNPPNYRNWRGLAVPMLTNAIEAAKAGAQRLVFPGNVYNFDPARSSLISENSPQSPPSRKGAIRVEMEDTLRAAARAGARVLIVRAGDYFGPNAPGSWFTNVLVKPGRPIRSITYPGDADVGHAWAYLPDLGETVGRLIEREADLDDFDVFHFAGHYLERGIEMAEAVRRVAGVPKARIRRLPWFAIHAASPLVPLFRELAEMRYLWQAPLALDNRKLIGFLGEEPHTPLDDALLQTLSALGCLDRPSADARAERG